MFDNDIAVDNEQPATNKVEGGGALHVDRNVNLTRNPSLSESAYM